MHEEPNLPEALAELRGLRAWPENAPRWAELVAWLLSDPETAPFADAAVPVCWGRDWWPAALAALVEHARLEPKPNTGRNDS